MTYNIEPTDDLALWKLTILNDLGDIWVVLRLDDAAAAKVLADMFCFMVEQYRRIPELEFKIRELQSELLGCKISGQDSGRGIPGPDYRSQNSGPDNRSQNSGLEYWSGRQGDSQETPGGYDADQL